MLDTRIEQWAALVRRLESLFGCCQGKYDDLGVTSCTFALSRWGANGSIDIGHVHNWCLINAAALAKWSFDGIDSGGKLERYWLDRAALEHLSQG